MADHAPAQPLQAQDGLTNNSNEQAPATITTNSVTPASAESATSQAAALAPAPAPAAEPSQLLAPGAAAEAAAATNLTNAAATTAPVPAANGVEVDITMQDVKQEKEPTGPLPPSSLAPRAPATTTAATTLPTPAIPSRSRTSTPVPLRSSANNGGDAAAAAAAATGGAGGGRATSNAPAPADVAAPLHAIEHGAPFRKYLNTKVTPSLLGGMKMLAVERPNDPLRALGEFLLQKSKELEKS